MLHLELHVVEDAVKVDRVELDGYFDRRVLLEVNKGCLLPLFRIYHARDAFNALALLRSHLFTIEDHELRESFDHDIAVVRFASDWVVDHGQIE